MKRFLLGTIGVLGAFALAFWIEGGNLVRLILPSPLLITFFVPFCAVLAVWDLRTWGQAWADAFRPCADEARRANSIRLWNFHERICYAAGFVAFVAGCIIILNSSLDPARLSESFAVNLTSPLWAVFFAIVARILRYRIQARS